MRRIRPLGPEDADDLLALSRLRNTGSERFWVDRAPSFLKLGEFFGPTHYLGAYGDTSAGLEAAVGVSLQRRLRGGVIVDLPYIHDLRSRPGGQSAFAAARLIRAVRRDIMARYQYAMATVIDDNPLRASLTSTALLGRETEVERFSTVHVGASLCAPLPPPPRGMQVESVDAAAFEDAYRRLAPERDLAPFDARLWQTQAVRRLLLTGKEGTLGAALLIDQSDARRIMVGHDEGSTELRHVYLACLCPQDDFVVLTEFRRAAAEWNRRDNAGHAEMVFWAQADGGLPIPEGAVALKSTTYLFGEGASLSQSPFRELTLI